MPSHGNLCQWFLYIVCCAVHTQWEETSWLAFRGLNLFGILSRHRVITHAFHNKNNTTLVRIACETNRHWGITKEVDDTRAGGNGCKSRRSRTVTYCKDLGYSLPFPWSITEDKSVNSMCKWRIDLPQVLTTANDWWSCQRPNAQDWHVNIGRLRCVLSWPWQRTIFG